MAIFRLEAKIISRGNGHSVVAAAAYRTGSKIRDERTGVTHNYSKRHGVIESVILTPENAPNFTKDSVSLWNEVERSEARKDSQTGREFVLSLPRELSHGEQVELAVGWAKAELVSRGMIAEISFHNSKDGNNPHCHVLCPLRKIDGEKFSAKKPREWNEKSLLVHWRESWCQAENSALAQAGRPERVDHRSLVNQGIDRIPEPKIGKEAAGMKKRGVVEDPWRYQVVRFVRSLNLVQTWKRAIEKFGEIQQQGNGKNWWERSLLFASASRQVVQESALETWRKAMLSSHPSHNNMPDRDTGPEFSR
jgi:ATP-dependent exoDNAse (exonuclease V) alpha subunit